MNKQPGKDVGGGGGDTINITIKQQQNQEPGKDAIKICIGGGEGDTINPNIKQQHKEPGKDVGGGGGDIINLVIKQNWIINQLRLEGGEEFPIILLSNNYKINF